MARKLLEETNNRAEELLQELLEEVEQAKAKNKWFSFDIPNTLDKHIGVFKSVRVYGNYNPRRKKISLNIKLIENGTDEQVKTVIAHELIHATGIHNHRWQFKNKAWAVQNNLQYDACHDNYENVLPTRDRKDRAKYKITCTGCGNVFYRIRECELTNYPTHYRCSKCKSDFKIEKIK